MRNITIQTEKGPREVEATVTGQLCFHPAWKIEGWWAVTHLATGRLLAHVQDADRAETVAMILEPLEWDPWLEKRNELEPEVALALEAVGG